MAMAEDLDIFVALAWSHLAIQDKQGILQVIEDAARDQVINLIVMKLTPHDMLELERTLQQGAGEDKVLTFLRTKIPDLEAAVQARIAGYKQEIITAVHALRVAEPAVRLAPPVELERALRMLNQPG